MTDTELLEGLMADGITPLFQPLVDLTSGETVAFEALARGPVGPWHSPQALFDLARRLDRVRDLDWACREAAVRLARQVSFRHPLTLFVNAEPEAVGQLDDTTRWGGFADLRCHAEITERQIAADPARLLRAVDQVREQDWGLALDDIGAHPASLALLPALRPDVLKLDLRLLHDDDPESVAVVHAVLAHAERTGATVVAEGVETERQRDRAAAWGVRLGQGWLLGRPAPLPAPLLSPLSPVPLVGRIVEQSVLQAPSTLLHDSGAARRVPAEAVLELVADLERQAARQDPPPMVLASYPTADRYDTASRLRHADLARLVPLVAVLCPERLDEVPAGVYAGQVDADDPIRDDWSLIVLGTHQSVALTSRPAVLGSVTGPHDVVLSFDPDLVARAAYALLSRLSVDDAQLPVSVG